MKTHANVSNYIEKHKKTQFSIHKSTKYIKKTKIYRKNTILITNKKTTSNFTEIYKNTVNIQKNMQILEIY